MRQKKEEPILTDLIKERSLLKQDVYEKSKQIFATFKERLNHKIDTYRSTIKEERVRLKIEEKGDFESLAFVGSDVLVFNMHTNVFCFPKEHAVWKTSYVAENNDRAYCGIINVYNFLADSLLHGRMHDAGYLIARIFINIEGHYMVEGKGKLGFLFRDFINGIIDEKTIDQIIDEVVLHAVEFDLLTPPYDLIESVNVMQIQAQSSALQMKTGKRLGFRFKSETDEIK